MSLATAAVPDPHAPSPVLRLRTILMVILKFSRSFNPDHYRPTNSTPQRHLLSQTRPSLPRTARKTSHFLSVCLRQVSLIFFQSVPVESNCDLQFPMNNNVSSSNPTNKAPSIFAMICRYPSTRKSRLQTPSSHFPSRWSPSLQITSKR